jgi:autotransporter-associated beta strand protein
LFTANSTAGNARLINNAAGVVDFSSSTGPLRNNRLSAGSIEGGGNFYLGANQLTIGSSGLSTIVSGIISDCGADGTACENSGAVGGSLVKIGDSKLTLTGANTYTGGTAVLSGTLGVGNNSALGTGAVTLFGGTTLAFTANGINLPNRVILGGFIDPTVDTGANKATISGVISDGTIEPPGAIIRPGAMTFGPSAAPGPLTKTGSGVLILTAQNTYTGATTVAAGTLVVDGSIGASSSVTVDSGATLSVGSDKALGADVVTLLSGATLSFAAGGLNLANQIVLAGSLDPTIDTGANTETISGVISGASALTKTGSGALILTADNTYTGATTVATGTLVVDGSIAASPSLTLDPGATLGGSGTVRSLVVPAGASIAPGVSSPFSTLHVARGVTFLAGSTYVVDINAAGQSDKIAAKGKADLSGGAVDVLAAAGNYTTANRYTILTAKGGVSGQFASAAVSANLAFLTPTLSYDAKDVVLGFAQAPFASAAITPNQIATATAIQALGPGAPLYSALLGQSVAGARQAFDALSGEIHPSAASAAFDDTRLPREAVLDRLASPYGALPPGGATGFAAMNAIVGPSVPAQVFAAWGQAFGSFGHIGGDGNAATLDRSMGGFILGADASLDERYRFGVAGGYTQSTLSLDARGSSGSVDSTYAGLYGGASLQALQLRGGAFYAYNRYGTDRTIAFPGFADNATSGYGGDTLQAFGEAGWRMPVNGFSGPTFVEPFVGALAMRIDTSSFSEAGGVSALNGASAGYDYGATTLGVRTEASLFANMPLLARAMLGWRHVFGDVTPSSTLAFESAPSIPFTIAGAPIARDALVIEAGFDWKLTSNATIGLFYSGELAARDEDNAIKGKLEIAF